MSPESNSALPLARDLMAEFARATRLGEGGQARRYLWTDAFAVCNDLGLARATGEGAYLERALSLVAEVHQVLGRHRPDDSRRGWLSGLPEAEGARRPTAGGLRIGKPLPERGPGEPLDPRREWDRDGQYFHYLTQWMHALQRVGEETGQAVFHGWAVELARVAHRRFTVTDAAGRRRLVWKRSIDLGRTLVPSTGQHDPLDAWLTYLELAHDPRAEPSCLDAEIREAAALAAEGSWETDDALGIGALLLGVYRLARLVADHGVDDGGFLPRLVRATRSSVEVYARHDPGSWPVAARLAFRELGLAIGLHALERLAATPVRAALLGPDLGALVRFLPLAARLDGFWSEPRNRAAASWAEHGDINTVMLATSLLPSGYLGVGD